MPKQKKTAPRHSYYDPEMDMEFTHPREEYILTDRSIKTITKHWTKAGFNISTLRRLCKQEHWHHLRNSIARFRALELAKQAGAVAANKTVDDLARVDKALTTVDEILTHVVKSRKGWDLSTKEAYSIMIDLIKARRLLAGESTENIGFQEIQVIIEQVVTVVQEFVPKEQFPELIERLRTVVPTEKAMALAMSPRDN